MNKNAAISIIVLLLIAISLITAGSQGSITIEEYPLIDGYRLFAICGSIGLILHWIFFIPSYVLKTDHYFDLIGFLKIHLKFQFLHHHL